MKAPTKTPPVAKTDIASPAASKPSAKPAASAPVATIKAAGNTGKGAVAANGVAESGSAKGVTALPPAAAAATSAAVPAPGMPVRSARPSSRLAQLTVPSMAQSVASTAAKASYSQAPPSIASVHPVPVHAKKDPKLAQNWKTKPAEQLTDAEVLAMPDAEYMNEKQVAFFRSKLVQLRQDMLNNAGETTEHLREDTVVVPDPADRATIEEEHALELRTRDRERKLLKKIEQSISRIDAGDYGYCDETGEPIGVGRLLARPTATLSLEAQQRRELKQKMFGD